MSTAPTKTLETFPNPQPDRDYIIEIRAPEFTCLCPKTGQPDFATLFLEYVPDQLCVELKSLKLYVWSFRNEGHFHEKVTNTILNDLVAATQPRYMRLRAEFYVRGGVYTTVTAEHRQSGWTPIPAPPGHLPRTEADASAGSTPIKKTTAPATPKARAGNAPAATPATAVPVVTLDPETPGTDTASPAQNPERFRLLQRKRGALAGAVAGTAKPTVRAAAAARDLYIGIDLGTSSCRAVVLDTALKIVAQAEVPLAAPLRQKQQVTQDPNDWWKAVGACLKQVAGQVDTRRVHRLAVAAPASTLLLCDAHGQPLTPGLMYDDRRSADEAERIASIDNGSAARDAGSSLAKLLWLHGTKARERAAHALHQADWISNRLAGKFGHSDYHNCLTLGYDAQQLRWHSWLSGLDVDGALLPQVHAPGEPIGMVTAELANLFDLAPETEVVAGTTDGVAAFLSTGAAELGHGVTTLGHTLALNLLSEQPIMAAQYGVYSHRLGRLWLAGGISNSGGATLLQYFTVEQLRQMTPLLNPEQFTDLDYYPLAGVGERFPIHDPKMEPRLEPLPGDSTEFLQGILEGIARIEAHGYQLLAELGAPPLRALWTTGGGSRNPAWTRLRERIIGLKSRPPRLPHAACGAALLAMGVLQKAFTKPN
jgi:D-ribulokinase